jgi:hypothetical protein
MVTRVVAETFPYDRVHDTYQEYYRNAMRESETASGYEFIESSSACSQALLRALRTVRHSYRLRHLFSKPVLARCFDFLARSVSRGPVMGPAPPSAYTR